MITVLHPKKKVEAKENLQLALKAIVDLKENFKIDYIIDYLRGKETEAITAHKHDDTRILVQG